MICESAQEPLVVVPDGAHSQLLALVGSTLHRRAGLPWRYAGSRFASDGESVACIEASTRHVDGLRLSGRSSWRFPSRVHDRYAGIAVVRGRFFLARARAGRPSNDVLSAPMDALGSATVSRSSLRTWSTPGAAPAQYIVDAGDRVLAIAGGAAPGAHVATALSAKQGPADVAPLPTTVDDEALRAVTVAGDWLVVLGGSAAADSIALYDRCSLECVVRLARDAVIPRFTAATCVEDSLVVVDDRPGFMAARIDTLVAAFHGASNAAEGARVAAARLRSTWRESPIGTVRELQAIPGSSKVIALVDAAGPVSATVWAPLSTSTPARDRWTD